LALRIFSKDPLPDRTEALAAKHLFEILRKEVAAAIQRRVQVKRHEEMKGVLEGVAAVIKAAEVVSLESYRQGTESRGD
jgi:hypothetical protein